MKIKKSSLSTCNLGTPYEIMDIYTTGMYSCAKCNSYGLIKTNTTDENLFEKFYFFKPDMEGERVDILLKNCNFIQPERQERLIFNFCKDEFENLLCPDCGAMLRV